MEWLLRAGRKINVHAGLARVQLLDLALPQDGGLGFSCVCVCAKSIQACAIIILIESLFASMHNDFGIVCVCKPTQPK